MAQKATAILTLALGSFSTELAIWRIETKAHAPSPTITHTCRSPVHAVDRCSACKEVIRVTGVQKSGPSAGKPATEPKDPICPHCQVEAKRDQATECGTCDRVIEDTELQDRLELDGETVLVTKEQLTAWEALLPPKKAMQAVALVPTNTINAFLRDEAYQVVPNKPGHAIKFRAWLEYLARKRLSLVVRYQTNGTLKIGAMYATSVGGDVLLVMHTLHSWDAVELQKFETPEVSDAVIEKMDALTEGLRTTDVAKAIRHPQREAFRELWDAGTEAGTIELKMVGAWPGEKETLAKELDGALTPPKPKKGMKAKEEESTEAAAV